MNVPPVKESIDEAIVRIEDALASGDCNKINELNPLGRPGLATKQRCEVLRRLTDLKVTGAEQYGRLGAVVGFERGLQTLNAVMLRDSDGLLHIALIEALTGKAATKGELARQFEAVADDGVSALADRDCAAFIDVAYKGFGIGSSPEDEVCPRVEDNVVAALLESGGEDEPVELAGSSTYAFFGLRTPASFITLIAAGDGESYGIVDALRTNPREPIEAPDSSSG